MSTLNLSTPLRLYVHIPFCVHKCHYCDFNSHVRHEPPWQSYQQALLQELGHWAEHPAFRGRKLASVFFGGGTPSLAPASLIAAVIAEAKQLFGTDSQTEITLESNPGSADAERFMGYRQAGINRLSIGVQSLDNTMLRWLERIHNSDEAIHAFQMARTAGFDNISIDLMFGLPEQTLEHWLETLHMALKLKPEHISCYQLTVEAHTALAARHAQQACPLPDDALALAMLYATREHLARAGYLAYEISNFSRPQLKCRHNDGYWQYDDYIGIGAGAAGKWNTSDGGITRYSNIRTPERYMERAINHTDAINSSETLTIDEAAGEACWLALRRSEGLDRRAFRERFGIDAASHFTDELEPWLQQQMLTISDDAIALTQAGLPLADSIAASVL
ncbi:radical SAM family heme chaperone HemW [Mariprofundus erugo]|uniref:radical SAM family heme chaperone HemW n=1 Tax=Mariprofundus erugo TaxID=2528639 RepID=UPI001EE88389|nr:radical SAM family heme chaperone HemW [Mariprofundus erugo]